MKFDKLLLILIVVPVLCLGQRLDPNQQDVHIAAMTDIGEDLDLYAVADLFQTSPTLEDFEMSLNDPTTGINNLDLDEDGYTDYIRVMEETEDNIHWIGLEAMLLEDDNREVAVIQVDKNTDNDDYTMEITGSEEIYGDDYTIEPETQSIKAWPIIVLIARSHYRPYRSIYYYGHYPKHYKRWHHVPRRVYRTKMAQRIHRRNFVLRKKYVNEKAREKRLKRTIKKRNYEKNENLKKPQKDQNDKPSKPEGRLKRPTTKEKQENKVDDNTTTKRKLQRR